MVTVSKPSRLLKTSRNSDRVSLLAKGATLKSFDGEGEVWGLNQLGKDFDLNRLFVMDDLKSRLPHWDADLPDWLKTYDKEIITSKVYPEWPTSVRFPLEAVSKFFGMPLGISFYSSVDYMIALAIYEGYDEINLCGVDCANPRREHTERCSIARWIAVAQSKKIRVITYPGSFFHWFTQTGICYNEGLYGYDRAPRIENL
jgi:hypothetical protein